jgi:phosphosulfolactate synthase
LKTALTLPERSSKPRRTGLTVMIDGGLPSAHFTDVIRSGAPLIDLVKFGWGTALVTPLLAEKLAALAEHDVGFYFGGTLFEKFVAQDCFDDFRALCLGCGATRVEVSNGTIDLSNTEKAGYIRKLAADFEVISEVGFKDQARSAALRSEEWVDSVCEDALAGASLITLEARESGRSGICRADGLPRTELVDALLDGEVGIDRLIFEAPNTALQSYFVTRIGPDVNLGNVPATGIIGLETLRLGLRSDTLLSFD